MIRLLRDGEEILIDYARANGRVLLNNVSFGVYAQAVHRDEYREEKLSTLKDVLSNAATDVASQAQLRYVTPDGQQHDRAPLLIVSNNRYRFSGPPDYGRRSRLDSGRLGIGTITELPERDPSATRLNEIHSMVEWEATSYRIESDEPILAGLDGEALVFESPLDISIQPRGLRVLVPAGTRPGYVSGIDAAAARLIDLVETTGLGASDRGQLVVEALETTKHSTTVVSCSGTHVAGDGIRRRPGKRHQRPQHRDNHANRTPPNRTSCVGSSRQLTDRYRRGHARAMRSSSMRSVPCRAGNPRRTWVRGLDSESDRNNGAESHTPDLDAYGRCSSYASVGGSAPPVPGGGGGGGAAPSVATSVPAYEPADQYSEDKDDRDDQHDESCVDVAIVVGRNRGRGLSWRHRRRRRSGGGWFRWNRRARCLARWQARGH
jgi:hypothetical protein